MEWLSNPDIWLSLATLSLLEIVLGVDNLVYIAIVSSRLPEPLQALGRRMGLIFALVTRIGLLGSISWIASLVDPVFVVWDHPVSWRDIIMIGGGVFLVAKATHEIHGSLEGDGGEDTENTGSASPTPAAAKAGMIAVVAQIAVLDIVFSLDSVITAVGMASDLRVMVAAVVLASAVMVVAANPLSALILRHPTIKMLALSFLLLVGMTLVADGMGHHVPKGYLYFAMGFSLAIEVLNLLARRGRRAPVKLRTPVP
ncbi:MAG: TerC family protein [Phaeospirillum sp.]|nr:TerC family protein [Phaeospirillum sp.]